MNFLASSTCSLATAFCTKVFASQSPETVRRLVAGGHEVAAHGLEHSDPGDPRQCREELERICGCPVTGYRSPRMAAIDGAALAAVTMTFPAQAEKTAKAVVQDGNKTLKFVYDAADYRPTQCSCWFYKYENLATIQGLANLNTSKATSLAYMFFDCWSLTSLDLSGFDTAKVTDMSFMFSFCSSLKTIFVSDAFATTGVTYSGDMFFDCTALVGGAGTAYDSAKTDATYARIDGGPSAPGYFTYKAPSLPKGAYGIRFVANGGTGTMADQICTRDKVYNLTKCAFTEPTGKAFAGWAGSNGKRYDDGILIFNAAAEGKVLTLTAVWK